MNADRPSQPQQTPTVPHGARLRNPKDPQDVQLRPYGVTATGALPVRIEGGGWKPVARATLDTSDTVVLTTSVVYGRVKLIVINNDGSTVRTFQLHHRASGVAAGNSNLISGKTYTLAVGEEKELPEIGMEADDIISGLCSSANTVTVRVYAWVA